MDFTKVALLTFSCILGLMVSGLSAQFAQYVPVSALYPGAGSSGFAGSSGLLLLGAFLIFFLLFSQFNTAGTTSFSVVNLTG